MVLQRAPLGQRGSYLATGLNVLQCLGWSVFEITVIATAAGALSDRLFGVHLVWMWKLVFGALGLVLALLGPVGFVRRFVRKIGIWAVAASIVYLAVWILRNGHVGRLWHEGGHGGSFWLGVDLVIALTVSWVPLVADYTRFSRNRALGVRRRRPRLPPADALPVRLRRDPRALASVDRRPDRRAHDGRRGRRRLAARAARADGRRDRRGVREHLLDRGLAPERRAARVAAAADRRRRRCSRPAISLGIDLTQLPAVPAAARRVLRAALRRAARRLARRGPPLHARARLRRAALAAGHDRRRGSSASRSTSGSRRRRASASGRTASRSLHPPSGGIGASLPSFAVSFALALGRRAHRRPASMRPRRASSDISRVTSSPARRRRSAAGRGTRRARSARCGRRRSLFAKCGDADRARFQTQARGARTARPLSPPAARRRRSRFSYDGDGTRTMQRRRDRRAVARRRRRRRLLLRRVEWLQVAPLLRGDFDADPLAAARARTPPPARRAGARARARDRPARARRATSTPTCCATSRCSSSRRRRPRRVGDLEPRSACRRSSLTLGARGSRRDHARRRRCTCLRASSRRDPTGAGDAFAVGVPRARAPTGTRPLSAARRATALVAALLAGRAMIAAVDTRRRRRSLLDVEEETMLGPATSVPDADAPKRRAAARRRGRRRPARRSSRSSTGGRRSRSRATAARRGASPAAACPPASRSRSPTTIPTGCSTRRATGSTSR